jgi:DNA polymerase-3 subunit epsilon
MRPFVAIDFETADPRRDSACAVGLARVEAGEIVARESALIRPPRNMHPACQAVHGLKWSDVSSAPPFPDVWRKLSPVL